MPARPPVPRRVRASSVALLSAALVAPLLASAGPAAGAEDAASPAVAAAAPGSFAPVDGPAARPVVVDSDAPPAPAFAVQSGLAAPTSAEAATSTGAATGGLAGTVTGPDGAGLAGICVTASGGPTPARSQPTTGSGAYTVTGLEPGSYHVLFETCDRNGPSVAEWYDRSSGALAEGGAVPVVVGTGTSRADGALAPGGTVRGTATGPDGAGLGCLGVRISGGAFRYARTAPDGTFSVGGLPTGRYRVEVSGPDCAGRAVVAATVPATTYLPVAPGRVLDANVRLALGGSISGTAYDAASPSTPVSDLCVNAHRTTDGLVVFGGSTAPATAARPGAYLISGLPAGRWTVQVGGCGNGDYAPTWYGGSTAEAAAAKVVISEAALDATGKDVRVQPAGSISGTVYAGSGTTTPLSSACVFHEFGDTRRGFGYRINPDGTYRFTGLPLGQYRIRFVTGVCDSTPGYQEQYYNGGVNADGAVAVSLTLSAPHRTGVDAHLIPAGEVSGVLTRASDGAPLAGVCARLVSGTSSSSGFGSQTQATTDSAGRYRLTGVPAARYQLQVVPDCGSYGSTVLGWYSGGTTAAAGPGGSAPLTVTGGRTTTASFRVP